MVKVCNYFLIIIWIYVSLKSVFYHYNFVKKYKITTDTLLCCVSGSIENVLLWLAVP